MNPSAHIQLGQQVIGAFAHKHGLADFSMNDEGEAVLDFAGIESLLYMDSQAPALHFTAPLRIGAEEEADFKTLLEVALELNMFPDKLKDARYAYSRDLRVFVLCKRIDLVSLPNGELDEPLAAFLEALDFGVQVLAPKDIGVSGEKV